VPEGERWIHEIKFDGYRLICSIDRGKVRLQTRNGLDWTSRFKSIATVARTLPVESAILDGEVVGLLPNGASSLPVLQAALRQGATQSIAYFVFDLLYLNGFDLRKSPLEARKAALASVLKPSKVPIQYVDHVESNGVALFEECRRLGLEGVISKRRDCPYRETRSPEWLKCKCVLRDEFVIGGFTDPAGSRNGLGAILVGHFDREKQFVYAGKVGTGFDDATLLDLRRRLGELQQSRNPFTGFPRDRLERGTHWVQPQLVAQVQYAGWTGDNLLWHPVFQGERSDVMASDIIRDRPGPAPTSIHPTSTPLVAVKGTPLDDQQLAQLASVQMTHANRVMYDDPPFTKLDLARYYVAIADWILPHIVDRPLSLVRCPAGQGRQSFFQKHPGPETPDAVRRLKLPTKEGVVEHLYIEDLAGLVSLVQVGVLEIHPWGSRVDRIERPDRLIFDLDPGPGVSWPLLIEVAQLLRDILADAGLTSFLKTTGSKGLHVVLPIERRHDWDTALEFCRAVAKRLVSERPQQLTVSPARQNRMQRIYVDYHRNHRGATAVAAYSTRNRSHATVAVPLDWSELSEVKTPDHFTVHNLLPRLARLKSDPWADLPHVKQFLSAAVKRAFGM
jgi:bifunctional non-homologous end joining protein LigD